MDKLLDEDAFNDAFEANKNYKPDLDHHWLYTFVSYYESAKQARNKHSGESFMDIKDRVFKESLSKTRLNDES